ncbi:MAG: hypothetical protein OXC91_08280 [Rhodobacteraceae bacterium]|nr:hypothetical protein [Paracoccaceae bacterium]
MVYKFFLTIALFPVSANAQSALTQNQDWIDVWHCEGTCGAGWSATLKNLKNFLDDDMGFSIGIFGPDALPEVTTLYEVEGVKHEWRWNDPNEVNEGIWDYGFTIWPDCGGAYHDFSGRHESADKSDHRPAARLGCEIQNPDP